MTQGQPKLDLEKGGLAMVALVKRKEGTTAEEFRKWWFEVHAPLVAPFNEKNGVVAYRQFHVSGKDTTALIGQDSRPDGPGFLDYDGILFLELESVEKWHEAVKDPYYANVVLPDEEAHVSRKTSFIGAGRTFTIWKDGAAA